MIGFRVGVSLSRNGYPNRPHMGVVLEGRAIGNMAPASGVGVVYPSSPGRGAPLGTHHGGWVMVKGGPGSSGAHYIDIGCCF